LSWRTENELVAMVFSNTADSNSVREKNVAVLSLVKDIVVQHMRMEEKNERKIFAP